MAALSTSRLARWAFAAAALAFTAWFYYRYVPLVPAYQIALVPLLLAAALASARSLEAGLTVFFALVPLANNLPYFFGIAEAVPHAPVGLVLFLAFFLGRAVAGGAGDVLPSARSGLSRPIALFALLVAVSAAVTFARYLDFAPVLADRVRELTVNSQGLSAGGARMSVLFTALSYLSGLAVFGACVRALENRRFRGRLLGVLAGAVFISLLFGAVQKTVSASLGNLQTWWYINQINATYVDPNAFAAFVAAFMPVAAALALSAAGRRRIAFAGLTLACLLVLPFTGSRTAIVAIGAGTAVFVALALWPERAGRPSRRTAAWAAAAGGAAIVLLLAWSLLGTSVLGRRLAWSSQVLTKGITTYELFNLRLPLWQAAVEMLRGFPATGVGVGAYIVELPHYLVRLGGAPGQSDSALNYALQVGSELGLPGLAAAVWLLAAVLLRAVKSAREGGPPRDRWLKVGAAAGLFIFLAFYQLHTFIGSYEVTCLFWLLAALALGSARPDPAAGTTRRRGFGMAALLLAAAFGLIHLWLSAGSLSIGGRAEEFGWRPSFGLGAWEDDGRGGEFRWTGRSAGFAARAEGPILILPVIASHPDLAERPVRVDVYLADRHFRKREQAAAAVFNQPEWRDLEVRLSRTGTDVYLVIETDRTWSPRKELGVQDARLLGAGLGRPRFAPDDR